MEKVLILPYLLLMAEAVVVEGAVQPPVGLAVLVVVLIMMPEVLEAERLTNPHLSEPHRLQQVMVMLVGVPIVMLVRAAVGQALLVRIAPDRDQMFLVVMGVLVKSLVRLVLMVQMQVIVLPRHLAKDTLLVELAAVHIIALQHQLLVVLVARGVVVKVRVVMVLR
jgi:hypothetical protein